MNFWAWLTGRHCGRDQDTEEAYKMTFGMIKDRQAKVLQTNRETSARIVTQALDAVEISNASLATVSSLLDRMEQKSKRRMVHDVGKVR